MPSWRASDEQKEQADTPPGTTDAAHIEAARKLLEELFSEEPPGDDEKPSQPEL